MSDEQLDELIQRVDLDGLVRLVDDRCESRDWDGLRRVRDRCRAATETGRQLWPATTLAGYRLALLAPAPWAAEAVGNAGRFTIGPLTEVVAQYHEWADLEPHLDPGPAAVYVAHERALRGEWIDPRSLDRFAAVLELPPSLRPWEPQYPLAAYHDDHAEFPSPPLPTGLQPFDPPSGHEVVDDVEFDEALRHLVTGWTAQSEGWARTVCVEGNAASALHALGVERPRGVELTSAEALSWLGWAGASGGAHGRRRGAAAGRDAAWWVLGAIGDLHDDWPPDDAAIEELLDDLTWWWWDANEPQGWSLRLVVEDDADGVAWAVDAGDRVSGSAAPR